MHNFHVRKDEYSTQVTCSDDYLLFLRHDQIASDQTKLVLSDMAWSVSDRMMLGALSTLFGIVRLPDRPFSIIVRDICPEKSESLQSVMFVHSAKVTVLTEFAQLVNYKKTAANLVVAESGVYSSIVEFRPKNIFRIK